MENTDFKKAEFMLYEYKNIDNKIDILKFKLDKIKNDVSLSSIDYSKDKISSTNSFNSAVENEVIHREKEIASIEKEIAELQYNKELVEKTLTVLEDRELDLVKLRYFSKNKPLWNNVAMQMNQSYDNCIKIRRKAISKMQSFLV